jgi:hypothetical protein
MEVHTAAVEMVQLGSSIAVSKETFHQKTIVLAGELWFIKHIFHGDIRFREKVPGRCNPRPSSERAIVAVRVC